jgi:hypothetical protein
MLLHMQAPCKPMQARCKSRASSCRRMRPEPNHSQCCQMFKKMDPD